MNGPVFEVMNHESERFTDFYVNGVCVGNTSYAKHSWSGIEAMYDMFESIAHACGAEVVEIDEVDE